MLKYIFKAYKYIISPFLSQGGCGCRYMPTCSEYAEEAFCKHNFFMAFYLTIRRILRCSPFSDHGYDPVPEPKVTAMNKVMKK